MAYRVSLTAPAEADAYEVFERIREAAPTHAERWLTKLFEAILSLDKLPARCPVFLRRKSLAIPRDTCCSANGMAFTGSYFISAKTSSTFVFCEFGMHPAT